VGDRFEDRMQDRKVAKGYADPCDFIEIYCAVTTPA